jgi:hypothetical protein
LKLSALLKMKLKECERPLSLFHVRNSIWPLPRWMEARSSNRPLPGSTRNQQTNHPINLPRLLPCLCWNLSSAFLQNVILSHFNMLLTGFVRFM